MTHGFFRSHYTLAAAQAALRRENDAGQLRECTNAKVEPVRLDLKDDNAGIKTGELHQGHFNANPFNYLEGNVPVPAFAKPILLIGRENMNRAVQGDVVVIEVFDEKDWKAPGDAVVEQECKLLLFDIYYCH